MNEIMAYVNAFLDLSLGFGMLVVMGFMFYLLSLALVTMVRNKQPRWDAIVYVVAILVLGLAMWRFFPTIAVRTMRVSLEEARPEVLLLQDEVRQWIPEFEVSTPVPTIGTDVPTLVSVPFPASVPTDTPTPTPIILVTTLVTETVPATSAPVLTATPYPTYTPWPTPTTIPTPTPCLVNVGGNYLLCPPTPISGGK